LLCNKTLAQLNFYKKTGFLIKKKNININIFLYVMLINKSVLFFPISAL